LLSTYVLTGGRVTLGKGNLLTMKATSRIKQSMVRQAFGLLLELRAHQNAYLLLAQAIAFLEMLGRGKEARDASVILSIRVMPVGRP